MGVAVVVWTGCPDGRSVRSPEQLSSALADVEKAAQSQGPLLMVITRRDDGSLAVGVSEIGWWLGFTNATNEPPYFQSKGEVGVPGDDINFDDGHEGPWVRSDTLIPAAVGRRAALEFGETGHLSKEVPWEEV